MMILQKSIGVKILNGDKVIVLHKLSGDFVSRVFSLIGDMLVSALKISDSLTSAVRAFLSTCDFTLLASDFSLRLAEILRRFKEFAVGRGDEVADAQIKANNSISWFKRFCLNFTREANVVFPGLPSQSNGLNLALDFPMPPDFEFADMLDIQLPVVPDFRPIAVGKLNRFPAAASLESWIAGLLASLHASEESLKRFIKTAESALARAKICPLIVFVYLPFFLVCRRLVAVGYRLPRVFPRGFALCKGIVENPTVRLKHFVNCLSLLPCRIQPVLECLEHWLQSTRPVFDGVALTQKRRDKQRQFAVFDVALHRDCS
jgi:hypothetical protein